MLTNPYVAIGAVIALFGVGYLTGYRIEGLELVSQRLTWEKAAQAAKDEASREKDEQQQKRDNHDKELADELEALQNRPPDVRYVRMCPRPNRPSMPTPGAPVTGNAGPAPGAVVVGPSVPEGEGPVFDLLPVQQLRDKGKEVSLRLKAIQDFCNERSSTQVPAH